MFSSRKNNRFRTVTFRLTAWYLILFTILSLVLLVIAQTRMRSFLRNRTDQDLAEDLQEMGSLYQSRGLQRLQTEFNREANSAGIENTFLVLFSPSGERLAASNLGEWAGLRLPPEDSPEKRQGEVQYQTVQPAGHQEAVRVAWTRLADQNGLCLGQSLADENELMDIFRDVLVAAMLGMLVSGGIMGWLLARRAMAGVERITRTAVHIGRDRLGERVSVGHEGQEIENLAIAFNGMLERIDALVTSLREVTDNVAHDLRSPITRLRGMAESALTTKSALEDYKELAAQVIEEGDQMIHMLNTMLEIAETDSGAVQILNDPVNLADLVKDTHELYQPAAEDHGLNLEWRLDSDALMIRGDVARLRRVLANLLDNAIKHTPRGGSIRISTAQASGQAAITVADTGAGIEANDLPRIFERFYRGDTSRTRPGSGLGLSLSLAIVRAHGGRIEVQSVPAKGSVFTVYLPRPAAPV